MQKNIPYHEVQCDGLIGCTHNYAGLSFGNVASQSNAASIAYPRQAALQGLEKMRFVHNLGIPQVILPPPLRPNHHLLSQMNIDYADGAKDDFVSGVVKAAWSASTMWSANAATISPAPDTTDGHTHITIANLASSLHRAQEAAERAALFQRMFADIPAFTLHPPLLPCVPFTDEGAANHMRLAPSHAEAGIEIFVYGKDDQHAPPKRYPARQTLHASRIIARTHHVPEARTVFARQHPDAIDAGVFHNDVIAMSNEHVMIYHDFTFADTQATLAELRAKAQFPLVLIHVSNEELPLSDAVKSYFYNSQLLTLPQGGMCIIAPKEAGENAYAHAALQRIVADTHNPISAVYYLDVRESMKNGGGPACLRLRIVMTEAQYHAIPEAYRFSPSRHAQLADFITAYYPEEIAPDMLYDHVFAEHLLHISQKLHTLF